MLESIETLDHRMFNNLFITDDCCFIWNYLLTDSVYINNIIKIVRLYDSTDC